MSKITIVGLGKVGLRHLEGCLKINKIKKIFAIDKERKRIELCKNFLRKKYNFNKIIFSSNFNKIKSDLAIISTNSKERLKITKQIIKKNKIKKLILEKFLTNNLSNLTQFETLLSSSLSLYSGKCLAGSFLQLFKFHLFIIHVCIDY